MAAGPVETEVGDGEVWEADADVASELRFSGPILSQDEIDSLLGYARGGVRAIVDSCERLPMLEIALDRLVRLMTTSLRNFTSGDVEVSIEETASISFSDYSDSIPLTAIVAVFRAGRTDNFGLVAADDNLIHSVVDALLGAGRSGARVEGWPYTAIERTLATRMIEVVLADAREAFSPLTEADFQFVRIETSPRFVAIAGPRDGAIVVKLRIGMEARGGRLELVLPCGAIEPIREDCRRKAPA